VELIKYAPTSLHYRLLDLLNVCRKNGCVPEEWGVAVVIPIFKKGKLERCENYRCISLLCATYKLHAKITARRISVICEPLLCEEKNCFRRVRSCTDSIFIIQQLLEKHREYNIETHLLFVDYYKAFDSVLRNKLWEI
jgi:hypothetical protein